MSIKVGDKAPDFTLVTLGANGPETLTLSEVIGEAAMAVDGRSINF